MKIQLMTAIAALWSCREKSPDPFDLFRAGKPVTDKVRLHQVVTQLQNTDDTSGAPGK